MELKELLVSLGQPAFKESLVRRAFKVLPDSLGLSVHKVFRVSLEPREPREFRVLPDLLDLLEHKVLKA